MSKLGFESLVPSVALASNGQGAGIVLLAECVDCGGTERVLASLAARWPQARIVTAYFDRLLDFETGPSWARRAHLVRVGRSKRHHLAPLYARRFASAPVGSARVVVSLAHGGWSLAPPIPPG